MTVNAGKRKSAKWFKVKVDSKHAISDTLFQANLLPSTEKAQIM